MLDMIKAENKFWHDYDYENHPELYNIPSKELTVEQVENIKGLVKFACELCDYGKTEDEINEIMFNEKNRI